MSLNQVLLDRAIENPRTAQQIGSSLSTATARDYLEGSLAADAKRLDKAHKWAEFLHRVGTLSYREYAYWIDRLSTALLTRARACQRPVKEVDVVAWNSTDATKGRETSTSITILSVGMKVKVGVCIRELLALGFPPDLLTYVETDEGLSFQKPYSVASSAWYPKISHLIADPETKIPSNIAISRVHNNSELLRSLSGKPNVLLVFGVPVLPRTFVEEFGGPIVNGHNGPLPYVRGLDSPAWCALLGRSFGSSVHIVDHNIDNGILLFRRTLNCGSKEEFDATIGRDMALAGLGLASGLSQKLGLELSITRDSYYSAMSLHTLNVVSELMAAVTIP